MAAYPGMEVLMTGMTTGVGRIKYSKNILVFLAVIMIMKLV